MALTQEQQAKDLLSRAKRILVVTREYAPVDAVASVTACLMFLQAFGKTADATAPGVKPESIPTFLPPAAKSVRPSVGAMRAFEVSLDISRTPMEELYYDVKDNTLRVTIIPKQGEWLPNELSFRSGEDRYDVVLAVDCPDLASLGSLFREHADFFYRTPVINIDRDPGNEHWGQLNLIDLTAVSTTEILYNLIQAWKPDAITADLATVLLSGMISKTQSFRTMNVTPKTLQTASNLVAQGARREEIVHGLWRTRSVPTLKLWGRALSRLEHDKEFNIVWTTLTRQDFVEAGAGEQALEGIIQELISYAPEAKLIVLVHEPERTDANIAARVHLHAQPPYSAQEVGRIFNAPGTRERVSFTLPTETTLVEGTASVVNRLRDMLRGLRG